MKFSAGRRSIQGVVLMYTFGMFGESLSVQVLVLMRLMRGTAGGMRLIRGMMANIVYVTMLAIGFQSLPVHSRYPMDMIQIL